MLHNQTLNDTEIILVDDGSTDNSPAICNEYAKNYTNKQTEKEEK